MPIQQFIMTRDINGFNGFGVPFSNNKYQALLEAGVEGTVTVPSTGLSLYQNILAVFSFQPGASVWVALNEAAVVPTGAFAQSGSEQNPAARYVKTGDVLHFKTSDEADEVGVIFYAVT